MRVDMTIKEVINLRTQKVRTAACHITKVRDYRPMKRCEQLTFADFVDGENNDWRAESGQSICPDIECSSACSAIATKTGYYVDSDTVIVDSKWGDDKGGSLFGCCRQRLFDFRSYFGDRFLDFRSTYRTPRESWRSNWCRCARLSEMRNEYLLVGALLSIGSPVRFEFSIVEQLLSSMKSCNSSNNQTYVLYLWK